MLHVQFASTVMLVNINHFWQRIIRESVEYTHTSNEDLVNRELDYQLSKSWSPALCLLDQRKSENSLTD